MASPSWRRLLLLALLLSSYHFVVEMIYFADGFADHPLKGWISKSLGLANASKHYGNWSHDNSISTSCTTSATDEPLTNASGHYSNSSNPTFSNATTSATESTNKELSYEVGSWPHSISLTTMFSGPGAELFLNLSRLTTVDNNELDSIDSIWKLVTEHSNNDNNAVCEFLPDLHPYVNHFPHSMQQLYACFSWWQANPTKKPVLAIEMVPIGYVADYIKAIQQVFKVKVLKPSSLVSNRSKYWVYWSENPDTPYAMKSPRDAQVLRDGIQRYYNITAQRHPTSASAGCPAPEKPMRLSTKDDRKKHLQTSSPTKDKKKMKQLPVIGFLNRNTKARRVDNHKEVIKALHSHYSSNSSDPQGITIHYLDSFDGLSYLEQITFMSQVDILISPHGAQLTSAFFLPTCGGLFEVFPKGYYVPRFFGSLATNTGHYHSFLYTGVNKSQEIAHYMGPLRGEARSHTILADPMVVVQAVQALETKWKDCCDSVEN